MSQSDHSMGPLRSEFADDPELRELVEEYVADLNQRLESLEQSWRSQSIQQLRAQLDQLKGSSASCGFPWIGDAARAVESPILDGETDLKNVQQEFNQLIDLCRRVLL